MPTETPESPLHGAYVRCAEDYYEKMTRPGTYSLEETAEAKAKFHSMLDVYKSAYKQKKWYAGTTPVALNVVCRVCRAAYPMQHCYGGSSCYCSPNCATSADATQDTLDGNGTSTR